MYDLEGKTYAYLLCDDSEHKKAKGTKKCAIKIGLMLKNYKDCLLYDKIPLKSQKRFTSDYHDAYSEQINKIALSSNNDKSRGVERPLQTKHLKDSSYYNGELFRYFRYKFIVIKCFIYENFIPQLPLSLSYQTRLLLLVNKI